MKVLIIDDHKEYAEELNDAFVLRGNEVLCTFSAKEGIELAQKYRPDVIILDIMMPEFDGYEACALLKSNDSTKHIPVLMLTAEAKEIEDELRGLHLAQDFVRKPKGTQIIIARTVNLHQQFNNNRKSFTEFSQQKNLKVLFLVANPDDMTSLRLDREMAAIDKSIRGAMYQKKIKMKHIWAATNDDLIRAILDYKPHIVHFSGHGNEHGSIFLENNHGHSQEVKPQTLQKIFKVLKKDIRCVILNACWTSIQAQAIANEIDCVIGMKCSIIDRAAIEFSAGFYRGIAYGENLMKSYEIGCIQIELENLAEENKPQINTMSDIDATEISFFF